MSTLASNDTAAITVPIIIIIIILLFVAVAVIIIPIMVDKRRRSSKAQKEMEQENQSKNVVKEDNFPQISLSTCPSREIEHNEPPDDSVSISISNNQSLNNEETTVVSNKQNDSQELTPSTGNGKDEEVNNNKYRQPAAEDSGVGLHSSVGEVREQVAHAIVTDKVNVGSSAISNPMSANYTDATDWTRNDLFRNLKLGDDEQDDNRVTTTSNSYSHNTRLSDY